MCGRRTAGIVSPTIALAGSLAQRPHHGGHAWVFLQYLLGLRRLGWDVLFLDAIEPDLCVDERGRRVPVAESVNLRRLDSLMRDVGLDGHWTLLHDAGRDTFGVDRATARERLEDAPVLIDVMGFLDDDELLAAPRRRAFLDIDPGFGQMWKVLDLADVFAGHELFVTIGERIGAATCAVPTLGFDWITTKQPVVLEHWPVVESRPEAPTFTSIASWRGPFGPIELDGRTYGLRVHEFRRFLELPARTSARFEVALDIDGAETSDLEALARHGWHVVDPVVAAGDAWRYREYVQRSTAELMVAKQMYVATRSGWFSDRSACYLASGLPVLAQDTDLDGLVPTGCGLVAFADVDSAVTGVEAILRDYDEHRRAARAIAEQHFASDAVLSRLLEALGVGARPRRNAR